MFKMSFFFLAHPVYYLLKYKQNILYNSATRIFYLVLSYLKKIDACLIPLLKFLLICSFKF